MSSFDRAREGGASQRGDAVAPDRSGCDGAVPAVLPTTFPILKGCYRYARHGLLLIVAPHGLPCETRSLVNPIAVF